MNLHPSKDDVPAWRQPIVLPRWVVFFQAAMLLVVGVTGFFFGLMVARLGGDASGIGQGVDSRLVGQVVWGDGEELRPDSGAVVVAIPATIQPDQRYSSRPLHPDRFVPLGNAAIDAIRKAGGDVTRTNDDGKFDLFVTGPGKFQVVVVSAHRTRREGGLSRVEAAELGAIFQDPEELVAGREFSVRELQLKTPFYDLGTVRF